MNFKLKIWRQADAKAKGGFETYEVNDISEDTSFLEMLDILNNNLIHEGKVLSQGTSEFLVNDELSRKFYLGDSFKM